MEQPLVSVILPFFNEEICLPRAVQSVLSQSYSNIELILVNNNSTDNSEAIANKFRSQHANIRLVNVKNGALGGSRNKGMTLAKGTYLAFLDADDELEIQMIEMCVHEAILKNVDVVNVGHKLHDEKGRLIKTSNNSGFTEVISGIETIKAVYSNKVFPTSWAKLYKTEIVKNLKFPLEIWFQDTPFFLEVLFNSQRIGFIPRSLMKVHSRTSSVTRRVISKRRVMDINEAFFNELDHVKKYGKNDLEKKTIETLIFMTHFGAMMDTLIVLLIDKHRITKEEMQSIQQVYLGFLTKIKKQAKIRSLKFPIKMKVLFSILYLPKYLGWPIPELLLYLLKFKKIKYLKRLKGS